MRHIYVLKVPICELGSTGEATRQFYRGVDCLNCLRRMISDSDERARMLRELLAELEPTADRRCRVYDTACINPSYCDARDACCAGDPNCVPSSGRGEAST